MAGDRQFTHSSGIKLLGKTKIYELPIPEIFDFKKAFLGLSGSADNFSKVIAWLHDPTAKIPKIKEVEMVILDDTGKIYHGDNLLNWTEIKEPYMAIGSGSHFALGALAAGKSPVEAVKVAHRYDPGTGKEYTSLKMK